MSEHSRLSDMSGDEFNAYTARVNAAMAHYHAHYNNEVYQAIQMAVVRDLYGSAQADDPVLLDQALSQPPAHAIMNHVIDVALEISGHPDLAGRHQQLLVLLMPQPISDETLHLMVTHWYAFEREGSAFVSDFQKTYHAARQLRGLLSGVNEVIQAANDIHGTAGNAAYHLTRASHSLLGAAELILWAEPSAAYINEQIQSASQHLADSQKLVGRNLSTTQPPSEPVVQPFRTLLLSADGTYPGIVTATTDRLAWIVWYKWGYEGETFSDWMLLTNVADFILSVSECQKRFGGFPPNYQA